MMAAKSVECQTLAAKLENVRDRVQMAIDDADADDMQTALAQAEIAFTYLRQTIEAAKRVAS